MKNLIRRGIRRYFQETLLHYHQGLENELVKFFCVFETKKTSFTPNTQTRFLMWRWIWVFIFTYS
jgi:hypothetical protein